MAKISGYYRWNDTLSVEGNSFLLDMAVSVNGARYVSAMIVSSTDDETIVALFDENEDMSIVYFSETGWIGALDILDETPIIAQSGLWQTWDFGEEQDVPDDFYAYLTANASQVSSAEAVIISYEGRAIASLESGQSATLLCEGKTMKKDIVVSVPEVAKGRYQFNSEINGYGLNTLADEDEVTEFLSSAENAIAGTLDTGDGDVLRYMFPYKTSDGTVSVISKLAEEEVPLFVLLPSGDVTEDLLTDSILNVVYAGKHSNWIFENTKKPQ